MEMTLTLITHVINLICCLHLPTFRSQDAMVSENSTVFTVFLQKNLSYKIWLCRKIGQGQPKVINLTNYDGLESQMLHIKFHGNRCTGSGEEDF